MKGSKASNPIPGVMVCCISEDAQSLLDKIANEYEKHYNKLVEIEPGAVTPGRAYSIFYWLCRHSRLVEGINNEEESVKSCVESVQVFNAAGQFEIANRGTVFTGPAPFSFDTRNQEDMDRFHNKPWVIYGRTRNVIGVEKRCIRKIKQGDPIGVLVSQLPGEE